MNSNKNKNRNCDCYSEFAIDHFKTNLESESCKKKNKYNNSKQDLEKFYNIGQNFFEDEKRKKGI